MKIKIIILGQRNNKGNLDAMATHRLLRQVRWRGELKQHCHDNVTPCRLHDAG
jgi:hypothetical protein